MTAKISDLVVAKILNLTPLQMNRLTQTPGIPAYMPPEVMVANPRYDTSVDEFSYHRWRKQGGTRGTCPPNQPEVGTVPPPPFQSH